MQRLKIDEDIKPLSEFRAHTAACIRQVQQSKRPVVITHNGKSAAVLVDVGEFEELLQRVDLLEDVKTAETQLAAGEGIPHQKALKMILKGVPK